MTDYDIIVIGSGAGGLTAAIALRRRGWGWIPAREIGVDYPEISLWHVSSGYASPF